MQHHEQDPFIGKAQRAADIVINPKAYETANEHVIELQDSELFQKHLEKYAIPFDDNLPEYWDAVSDVAHQYTKRGLSGESPEIDQLIVLAASAPSMVFNQYFLSEGEEHSKRHRGQFLYTREQRNDQVARVGRFNDLARNYLGNDLDTDETSFAMFLADAANLGVNMGNDAYYYINTTMIGIRTELGFEQKAKAAGLVAVRGSGVDDALGIDYRVEGVPIDIKTSLNAIAEKDEDPTIAWKIKGKRAIYYPYTRPEDYVNNTFRVTDEVLKAQIPQIQLDIKAMQKALRKT